MEPPEALRPRPQPEAGPVNPPGLPACHYRRRHDDVCYRCEAGEASIVAADDCRRCSIPEALAHPQACLYLMPLRHRNEAYFACPWYFSWAREPAVRDWRELCFCPYWFPRGPNEQFLASFNAERQARYGRVLRGEEPRSRRRIGAESESPAPDASPSRLRQLWQSTRKIVDAFTRTRPKKRRRG